MAPCFSSGRKCSFTMRHVLLSTFSAFMVGVELSVSYYFVSNAEKLHLDSFTVARFLCNSGKKYLVFSNVANLANLVGVLGPIRGLLLLRGPMNGAGGGAVFARFV